MQCLESLFLNDPGSLFNLLICLLVGISQVDYHLLIEAVNPLLKHQLKRLLHNLCQVVEVANVFVCHRLRVVSEDLKQGCKVAGYQSIIVQFATLLEYLYKFIKAWSAFSEAVAHNLDQVR